MIRKIPGNCIAQYLHSTADNQDGTKFEYCSVTDSELILLLAGVNIHRYTIDCTYKISTVVLMEIADSLFSVYNLE